MEEIGEWFKSRNGELDGHLIFENGKGKNAHYGYK